MNSEERDYLIKLFTAFLDVQPKLEEIQAQQKRYADHLDQFIVSLVGKTINK